MRRMMFDRVQHVPELPDRREWELEDGVLYIADDEPYAAWLCPCGCGRIVVASVEHENSTHPTWHIEEKDGKVTLNPSVDSMWWPCRSHYFVRENRIEWV